MNTMAFPIAGILLATTALAAAPCAHAAPCLIVTLTGTQSGPSVFNGLAGAGTLVRYGDDSDECGAVRLQFDAGRGTALRLSQAGTAIAELNAVFFTHMHSDHTSDFLDIAHSRWRFTSTGPKLDVICSADAASVLGVTVSCKKFVAVAADVFVQSGETALRQGEGRGYTQSSAGPVGAINLMTFEPENAPQIVWASGDVRVSAVRSSHVAGHASYRVDTPAGSVVIGGDARNDKDLPNQTTSTSEQVERLAMGADIIVHSTIHPVMAPDKGSGMPPAVFVNQSGTTDLGAMAKRTGAKYLMLTHLAPTIGAERNGPYKVPGGPLTESDFRRAVEASGYTGNIVVGTDLASVRLPAK